MSYPKENAPYSLEFGGYVDSTPVDFNLEETTHNGLLGIMLSFDVKNVFSADGTRKANIVAVGKEYGTLANKLIMTKAEMYASVVECPSQGLNCIKGMIGDVCESGIWDTPVAGNNGMVAVPPSTLGQIFIPYNDFWVQQCAVQTDGVECLYYVELSSVAGNVLKTKWVFKYAAPNLGVPNPCGVAPTVPATPATPTDPSGGTSKPPHGNKPPHAGGPNK